MRDRPTPTPPSSIHQLVAVRIRPLSAKELESGADACVSTVGRGTVVIRRKGVAGAVLKSQQEHVNEYAFDEAFGSSATQDEVYRATAAKHVSAVFDGINVTVIAYGATGAGKTHTMMGNTRRDNATAATVALAAAASSSSGGSHGGGSGSGIIPQSLVDIFDNVQRLRATQQPQPGASRPFVPRHAGQAGPAAWSVRISYCEVYNEQVFDLLRPKGSAPASLRVLEDAKEGVVAVQNLSEANVAGPDDVLRLVGAGNENRTTEATAANAVSSRSHAILWVSVREEWRDDASCAVKRREARLSLIDLAVSGWACLHVEPLFLSSPSFINDRCHCFSSATFQGSERASATLNSGARLNEGAKINRSLLALANCINALTTGESNAATAAPTTLTGAPLKRDQRRGSTGSSGAG